MSGVWSVCYFGFNEAELDPCLGSIFIKTFLAPTRDQIGTGRPRIESEPGFPTFHTWLPFVIPKICFLYFGVRLFHHGLACFAFRTEVCIRWNHGGAMGAETIWLSVQTIVIHLLISAIGTRVTHMTRRCLSIFDHLTALLTLCIPSIFHRGTYAYLYST